jgi:hypothetical protein
MSGPQTSLQTTPNPLADSIPEEQMQSFTPPGQPVQTSSATPVQEKPGGLFRNILAAGLMGAGGIGPLHGEHTFAQGLMAGAGAGIKESQDMAEKQDAARRDQAQKNYENQLKANKEKREDQQLSMQQQLNDVTVQEYINRSAISKFQLAQAYGEKDLTAVKHIVEQDNDKLHLFRQAGAIPFSKNIGGTSKDTFNPEEYQSIVADPSVKTAGYVPITVGWDKDNRPLIQLFPPEVTLTKDVIQTLQSKFGRDVNIEKDLNVREGQKLEPSKLVNLLNRGDATQNQREMSDKIQLIEAQTIAARAESLDKSLNAQKAKQDLKKGSIELQDFEDRHNGFEILRSIATGTPVDSGKKDSKGKPIMITIAPDNVNGFSTSFKLLGDNQKKSLFSAYSAEERDSENELDKVKTIKGEASPEYQKEFEHLQTIRNTRKQLGPISDNETGAPSAPPNPLDPLQSKYVSSLPGKPGKILQRVLTSQPDIQQARVVIAGIPITRDFTEKNKQDLQKSFEDYVKESIPVRDQMASENRSKSEEDERLKRATQQAIDDAKETGEQEKASERRNTPAYTNFMTSMPQ